MEATAGLKPGADTVLDAETLEALAGDIPTAELSRDDVARRTSPHDSMHHTIRSLLALTLTPVLTRPVFFFFAFLFFFFKLSS